MIGYNVVMRQSVDILSFGGSGVGKTSLRFGRPDAPGMFETLLESIPPVRPFAPATGGLIVSCMVYEIFNNKPIYYQYTNKKVSPSSGATPTHTFSENQRSSIIANTMADIDSQISEIRKKEQRIKVTENNPDSSRGALVYTFELRYPNETDPVILRIIDLPGYEICMTPNRII
jgi:hypothetical protein